MLSRFIHVLMSSQSHMHEGSRTFVKETYFWQFQYKMLYFLPWSSQASSNSSTRSAQVLLPLFFSFAFVTQHSISGSEHDTCLCQKRKISEAVKTENYMCRWAKERYEAQKVEYDVCASKNRTCYVPLETNMIHVRVPLKTKHNACLCKQNMMPVPFQTEHDICLRKHSLMHVPL